MEAPKYHEKPQKQPHSPAPAADLPANSKEQIEIYREIIGKLLEDPVLTKKAAQIISEMLAKKT